MRGRSPRCRSRPRSATSGANGSTATIEGGNRRKKRVNTGHSAAPPALICSICNDRISGACRSCPVHVETARFGAFDPGPGPRPRPFTPQGAIHENSFDHRSARQRPRRSGCRHSERRTPAECQVYAQQQAELAYPAGKGLVTGGVLGLGLGAAVGAATGGNVGKAAGTGAAIGAGGGVAAIRRKRTSASRSSRTAWQAPGRPPPPPQPVNYPPPEPSARPSTSS